MDRRTTDAPAVGQAELEKRKDRGEDKVTRMGTAPIGRLMLEFSIPAVAAIVLNSLYNVIDSIFLGQAMGEIGLARDAGRVSHHDHRERLRDPRR